MSYFNSIRITDGTDVLDITASNAAKVDGSAVTQPVSGTITANAGTNLNTSALLTENTFTGRLGEVQATPTANTVLARLKDISDGQLADSHNVTIDNTAGSGVYVRPGTSATFAVSGTFWQTTQPVSGTFWQTTQPVSGSVTADTELTTGDLDIGAGTDTRAVIGLVGSKDGGGELIPGSATDGLLVNLGANNDVTVSGVATSAGQLTDGHNVTIDNASTDEVYIRGGGTAGSAVDGEVVAVQGIASGTAIAVTESSPISGFATSANQLADGHNVTIDNASGASAVNIQDGGNRITTDHDYDPHYQAAADVNVVVKGSAGFLHAIVVGASVASSIIEVSNHASDGDGAVRVYLAGDTIGPAVYPINMTMSAGITVDITAQTHVTFLYK